MIQSMSRVAKCIDNGPMEGFWGILKRERINQQRYDNPGEARTDVFDYIERFHNPRMRRRVARQDQKFLALFKPSVETG